MIKKVALFFMFIVFIITVSGCETAKGALKGGIEGAKKDWETAKGVGAALMRAEGAKKDWETAKGVGAALMRADEWIQKNLW